MDVIMIFTHIRLKTEKNALKLSDVAMWEYKDYFLVLYKKIIGDVQTADQYTYQQPQQEINDKS